MGWLVVLWRQSYLRLASNGSSLANFLAPKRVNDGTLANIRITDEAHTDLLLVDVQLQKSEDLIKK